MRTNRTATLVSAIAAAVLATSAFGQEVDSRPNILLIVGDDVAFGDLGFAGSVTQTPNIDALAEMGAVFTRFHAAPVCSITRGMLMTGNDPVEIGLGAFDYTQYPPAEGKPGYEAYLTRTTASVAELLQDAGYFTAMVGKWHLGGTRHGGEGPQEWGFDRSYGIYTGGANHWNGGVFHVDRADPEQAAALQAGQVPQEPYFENGERVERPIGVFSDTLWTDRMIGFLEEARAADEPFFAYVAYTTPHAPLQAPDWLISKYEQHYYEMGYDDLKRARFESQKQNGIIPEDAPFPDSTANPLLGSWDDLSEEQKRREARSMAVYSAMMESQDIHVGLMLNYLEETEERDNTLIIYMSDNGPEGFDGDGVLSSKALNQWIDANFSSAQEDIGRGNSYAYIGTDMANSATGGLSWWKWFIGEGGVRVPMIVLPPSGEDFARTGAKTADFASVKDLPMTILDYAGVVHPGTAFGDRDIKPPSGVSVRPWLDGEAESPRPADAWHAFELFGNGYVVRGDFKASRVRTGMYGDGAWHLYDIRNDPGETTPLNADRPELLVEMVALYEGWAKEKGIVEVRDDWSPWFGFPEDR